MTTVVPIKLVLVMVVSLAQKSATTNMDIWTTLCPMNDFCAVKRQFEFNASDINTQPCCTECSCDEDCWLVNNCCPDVTHARPDGLQSARCTKLGIENEFADYGNLDSYHVLDFCPPDRDVIDSDVVDRCEGRRDDVSSLADVVAVSDSKNRIYKNKYCSLCHGVRDVEMWNLLLMRCRENMDFSQISASRYLATLLANCKIQSVPPNRRLRSQSVTMKCGISLSSDCPSSTGTDARSVEIVDICLNGPDILFVQQTTLLRLYKNVACYLCNTDVMPELMCPPAKDTSMRSPFHEIGVLLDMTLGSRSQSEMTSQTMAQRCHEEEIYHDAKKKCLTLYCAPYSVRAFGECLTLGRAFANYAIAITVPYEPVFEHIMTDIEYYTEQEAKRFIGKSLRKHGMKGCTYIKFHLVAFVERTSNVLRFVEVKINVKVDQKCQPGDIAKLVRTGLSKYENISISMNGIEVPLIGGKIKFYSKDSDPMRISVGDSKRYKQTNLIIGSTPAMFASIDVKFFLCPYFVLTLDEYNSIIKEVFGKAAGQNLSIITDSTRVNDGFYTLTNNTIAVCVDTYFDLYTSRGGNLYMDCYTVYLFKTAVTCWVVVVMSRLY